MIWSFGYNLGNILGYFLWQLFREGKLSNGKKFYECTFHTFISDAKDICKNDKVMPKIGLKLLWCSQAQLLKLTEPLEPTPRAFPEQSDNFERAPREDLESLPTSKEYYTSQHLEINPINLSLTCFFLHKILLNPWQLIRRKENI